MGPSSEAKLDFDVALTVEQVMDPNTGIRDSPLKKSPETEDSTASTEHSFENTDEFRLWAAFKDGSEKAFTAIYNQYIVSLYHYGERITPDKELIEDSIHDLFVDLWRNRDNLAHVHSIKFYLYKGLKRKIIRNLSLKRKFPLDDLAKGLDFEMVLSHEFNIIANEISEQQKNIALKALNKLTRRQKEAIILKFYDDLTYKEIGNLLSISTKSTYTLIYRAIDVLKRHLCTLYILMAFLK